MTFDPPAPSQRNGLLTQHQSPWRWGVAVLKLAAFVAVLYFVGRELLGRFAELSWSEVSLDWRLIAAVALGQAVVMLLVAWAYYRLLERRIRWRSVWAVVSVARMGKYVPGKFLSTVGATYLLHRCGVPVSKAVSAMLLGQGLMVVLGLMAGAPTTLWPPVYDVLPWAWWVCLLLAAACAVLLHPAVFGRLVRWMLRRMGVEQSSHQPTMGSYLAPIAMLLMCQVISGCTLWLLLRMLTPVSVAWIPLCISATAFAGAVGLLVLLAPGGIGVREGVLLLILGPVVGAGASALVVVVLRITVTLVELCMAGLAMAYGCQKDWTA